MTQDRRSKGSDIIPWIEASTLLGGVLVAAIATSSISLYRIDTISDELKDLNQSIKSIPLIQRDIQTLQSNEERTQEIFTKFSTSVDKLTVAVAKLEVKTDARERRIEK